MSKEAAKLEIKRLVEKYEAEKAAGKISRYSEEETKRGFIEPLFAALGWNFSSKEEITLEEQISGDRVDYGFYLNNRIKFYLEAKPFKVDLHREDYAKQSIRYSWNKGVTWAVLTDFESLIVFNALSPEKSLTGKRFFEIPYTEFLERFDQLWLLSKEAFLSDSLDKEAERHGKKIQKVSVTEKLAEDLNYCRKELTEAFRTWNKDVPDHLIDEGVQKLLDRLIFIRVAEDRKIEPPTLIPLLHQWKSSGETGKSSPYQAMIEKFRELDKTYNSNLFSKHPFEEWEEFSGATERVINKLYGDKDYFEYDFSVIPADVLGAVYENYLGYKLEQTKKKLLDEDSDLTKSRRKRKEQGIYYTPKFIVDYIVQNALGPVLDKCKSVNDLQKIKILDPACGSGSFLVAAMNFLIKKYEEFGVIKPDGILKINILQSNIYGVDLDEQAVELARLNLLLNTFDSQTKLPNLGSNIKNGNSLISGTDEELEKFFGKNYRDKKPFNWEEQFLEVFKQGGFDCVIGNPPYIRPHKLDDEFKKYSWDRYEVFKAKSDIYAIFMQKAVDILKDGGIFSFIVSNTWLTLESFQTLRKYILDHCIIQSLITLPQKVFEGATVETMIFRFKKEKSEKERNKNKISIIKFDEGNFIEINKISQDDYLSTHLNIFDLSRDLENKNFLFKIELKSKPLKEFIDFYYGLKTGDDDKFISNEEVNKEYKKLLFRSDFQRYKILYNNKYVWYVPEKMRKNKITARPGEKERFEKPKIIIQDISKKLVATFDDSNYYIKDALMLHAKGKLNLKYLLAFINSKLLNYWYSQQFKTLSLAKNAFLILPIYDINFSDKKEKTKHDALVNLADKMLNLNKQIQSLPENSDEWQKLKDEISQTDKKIDQEVYKLYNLTPAEIKIIEDSFTK